MDDMINSLQKIDHQFPESIQGAITEFKKGLPKTHLLSVKVQRIPEALLMFQRGIEKQIKDSLELTGDKNFFGKEKRIVSYKKKSIITAFKEQLSALSILPAQEKEPTIRTNIFMILTNLSFYLSSTGKYISSKDFQEIEEIIASKGVRFTIKEFVPELYDNIDKNSVVDEGHKSNFPIWEMKNFPVKIKGSLLRKMMHYANEDTSILAVLSDALIKEGDQKTLPGKEALFDLADTGMTMDTIKAHRQEIVHKESQKFKGYYSIGGKIHFKESVSQEKINAFQSRFGFTSTTFTLQHANKSILLPPSCSPNIILFYIFALQKFGLIEGEPDLQLSIPGRLPNWAAGILGSTMLFSSNIHVSYPLQAFATTHNDLTGAKIMAYDAGVLERNKHTSQQVQGRTDMLGIVDIANTYTYHMVGSMLSQVFYGGKYAKIGQEFIQEYKDILSSHGLARILDEEWIYTKEHDTEQSSQEHYTLIKTITDIQKSNREESQEKNSKDGLIVFEIKNLLNKYKERLKYK